jgi:MFS transporter, DHA2 family, multidrug resistance protein
MDTTATEARVAHARWWGLAALVLSGLVLALDMTILATALPTLSTRLGATTAQLQWISDAYTLALAGLLVPAGVLGDRFGRRRLLLLGLLLFGVASVAAAQTTSATALIAMRALMGVGGAMVMPLTLSILPSMFSEIERPRAVAMAAAGAFLGLPLGPLVAGWLLTHDGWGSIFLINAPVVALALLGVRLCVPESRDPEARRLDQVGAALSAGGVTGLVVGIIEEPVAGWGAPRVLAGILGGAVLIAAFVAHELRSRSPLVDLRLFREPRFTWSTVAFVIAGGAMVSVLFVLTPYLQVVQGSDAEGTGIRLLPMIGALVAGALASDRLTIRLGTGAMVAGGLAAGGAGMALLSRAGVDTGYGLVAAALAAIGLGIGLAMPPALDAILGTLPAGETGSGTALTRALQNLGATFGVAILGSMLNSAYRGGLDGHLAGLPGGVQAAARSGVAVAAGAARRLPPSLSGPLLRAAETAYAQAMGEVLLWSAALVAAGAIPIALFLAGRPRDGARGSEARRDGGAVLESTAP